MATEAALTPSGSPAAAQRQQGPSRRSSEVSPGARRRLKVEAFRQRVACERSRRWFKMRPVQRRRWRPRGDAAEHWRRLQRARESRQGQTWCSGSARESRQGPEAGRGGGGRGGLTRWPVTRRVTAVARGKPAAARCALPWGLWRPRELGTGVAEAADAQGRLAHSGGDGGDLKATVGAVMRLKWRR